jgi:hypothetical protein
MTKQRKIRRQLINDYLHMGYKFARTISQLVRMDEKIILKMKG